MKYALISGTIDGGIVSLSEDLDFILNECLTYDTPIVVSVRDIDEAMTILQKIKGCLHSLKMSGPAEEVKKEQPNSINDFFQECSDLISSSLSVLKDGMNTLENIKQLKKK